MLHPKASRPLRRTVSTGRPCATWNDARPFELAFGPYLLPLVNFPDQGIDQRLRTEALDLKFHEFLAHRNKKIINSATRTWISTDTPQSITESGFEFVSPINKTYADDCEWYAIVMILGSDPVAASKPYRDRGERENILDEKKTSGDEVGSSRRASNARPSSRTRTHSSQHPETSSSGPAETALTRRR